MTVVMPVQLLDHPYDTETLRHILVTDPVLGVVSVRWVLNRAEPWRCGHCGPMTAAGCPHTFAAGLQLAELLLGLTPAVAHDDGTHQEKQNQA